MRNGMEIENENERIQVGTHQGPFSWIEMIIMSVLAVIGIMLG